MDANAVVMLPFLLMMQAYPSGAPILSSFSTAMMQLLHVFFLSKVEPNACKLITYL
jgi:hypothetical protein